MAQVDPDAYVSRDFQWGEFDGWDVASMAELERLRTMIGTVLQPLRDVAGPVRISRGGWLVGSDAKRRAGPHGQGAAVDLVTSVRLEDAWRWIAATLRDPVRYGEVILEDDHVHVTLPGYGGYGEVLRELPDGRWMAENPDDWGDPADWPVGLGLEYGARNAGVGILVGLAIVGALAQREGRRG